MTLKLRKQTNNLPRYNEGTWNFNPQLSASVVSNQNVAYSDPYKLGKLTFLPNLSTKLNLDPSTPVTNNGITEVTPNGDTRGVIKTSKEGLDWSKGGNITSSAVGFAGSMINAWGGVLSSDQVLANAGMVNSSVGGYGYQEVGNINQLNEMKKLNTTGNTLSSASSGASLGAAIGSIFPGAGTVVGGIVGGLVGGVAGFFGGQSRKDRLKEQIRIANESAARQNTANRSVALSNSMQDLFYSQYGNTQDDILYANRGKDLKQPKFN